MMKVEVPAEGRAALTDVSGLIWSDLSISHLSDAAVILFIVIILCDCVQQHRGPK